MESRLEEILVAVGCEGFYLQSFLPQNPFHSVRLHSGRHRHVESSARAGTRTDLSDRVRRRRAAQRPAFHLIEHSVALPAGPLWIPNMTQQENEFSL